MPEGPGWKLVHAGTEQYLRELIPSKCPINKKCGELTRKECSNWLFRYIGRDVERYCCAYEYWTLGIRK